MIQLIVLGAVMVAAGVLVLAAERQHYRREARRRVRHELRRAAVHAAFRAAHAGQETRVQRMLAERAERGWSR